jgi:hypothetical protein
VAQVTNDFETGSSGTAVSTANSAGGPDTQWDFVQIGAGATNAYDNTRSAHGGLSVQLATPATATSAYLQWSSTGHLPGGAGPTWYLRCYVWLTANPAANLRLLNITTGGGSVCSGYINSAGKIIVTYGTAATTYVTFTTALTLGAWQRIEMIVTGDAAAGQVGASFYQGDSATATETHTSTATLATGAISGTTTANIGIGTSMASAGPIWVDDVGVSTDGYLGPVQPPPPAGPIPATPPGFLSPMAWRHIGQTIPPPAVPPVVVALPPGPVPAVCNSFADGSPGATVAASGNSQLNALGTAAGFLFDTVTVNAGSTMTYDSAQFYSGTQSCKITTTSAVAVYGVWQNNTPANTGQLWFRAFFYQAAWPGTAHQLLWLGVGGTTSADVIINTNGTLAMRNAAGTTVFTTTATVPNNAWYRVEGYVTSSATAGQCELKLFSTPGSATATETQTSAATLNTTGGNLSQVRFGLATTGVTGLTWWQADCAASASAYIGPGPVVQHMICGAPAPGGFTVASKPVGGTSLRLKVATDQALTANVSYVAAQLPDANGYVRHTATGLTAQTTYYCQLADTPPGGGEALCGGIGRINTLPAPGVPFSGSLKIALGSCINTATGLASPDVAMTDWNAWDPDLALFVGDFDYENPAATTTTGQVAIYENHLLYYGGQAQQDMLRVAWGYYCRSDHDSTNVDNGDSNNAWTASNIAANQVMFPQGTLGDTQTPPHGLYQSWVVGRVRFIMLDQRNIDRSTSTNTDNSSKTMLGATQLAWFEAQLTQPEPLKVVVEDNAWMGNYVTGEDDKWWSYSTERSAILAYISANSAAVGNILWLHGDSHALAVATAAKNATWGGFPVYCGSPMRQTGAAIANVAATFSAYYNGSAGDCRQYMRITLTDDGNTITTLAQGYDALNSVIQVSQTDQFSAPPAAVAGAATLGVTAALAAPAAEPAGAALAAQAALNAPPAVQPAGAALAAQAAVATAGQMSAPAALAAALTLAAPATAARSSAALAAAATLTAPDAQGAAGALAAALALGAAAALVPAAVSLPVTAGLSAPGVTVTAPASLAAALALAGSSAGTAGGSAALPAAVALAGAGTVIVPGAVSLPAVAALSAAGVAGAAASLAGAAVLGTAAGQQAGAVLPAVAALTAAGVTARAPASLAAALALAGASAGTAGGAAALAVAASLAGAGTVIVPGAASLPAAALFTAPAVSGAGAGLAVSSALGTAAAQAAGAALAAAWTLAASPAGAGGAAVAVTAALAGGGAAQAAGAVLPVGAALSGSAGGVVPGAAVLPAALALAAAAGVMVAGAASLAVAAGLGNAAAAGSPASLALLTAVNAPPVSGRAAAALPAAAVLSTAGLQSGAVTLPAVWGLSAAGLVVVAGGSAALAVTSLLAAPVTVRPSGVAAAQFTLAGTPVQRLAGSAVLPAAFTLGATALVLFPHPFYGPWTVLAPYGRWAAGEPHNGTWAAAEPHGAWACDSPHGGG